MKGMIFDIKELAIHDGDGPRVTVFLKGCPLRCIWCHNPEGLSIQPQMMVKQQLCRHCGICQKPCTHPECQPFGRCLYACPHGLISQVGTEWEAAALARRLYRYADFFAAYGGGVTFSGGEPLMQADFLIDVARRLPFHKTLETCGFAPPETFLRAVGQMDEILFDIKLADPGMHKRYTGQGNAWILRNFSFLQKSGKCCRVRTPLIPGITDTEENLEAIASLVGDTPWEKLPYNALAGAKYSMLGMEYPYNSFLKS